MARTLRVQWSTTARRDVRQVAEYIRARRPAAARRIVEELRRVVEHVRQHPEMGPRMEQLVEDGDYRAVLVEGYWVIYAWDSDRVRIMRVWDARRDPGSPRVT
jgi:plasmid stabilization system protein ParE